MQHGYSTASLTCLAPSARLFFFKMTATSISEITYDLTHQGWSGQGWLAIAPEVTQMSQHVDYLALTTHACTACLGMVLEQILHGVVATLIAHVWFLQADKQAVASAAIRMPKRLPMSQLSAALPCGHGTTVNLVVLEQVWDRPQIARRHALLCSSVITTSELRLYKVSKRQICNADFAF